MGNFIDLTGQRFGRLTAKTFDSAAQKWTCVCDCGNTKVTTSVGLRTGHVKGCGCVQRNTTHGMSGTPEHYAWLGMRKRCYDTGHKQFADYGGRGITVCDAWRDSFETFYRDMGPRPSSAPGKRVYSIDRKNNSLGYSKENCRWATQTEQQRNRRSNVLITHRGKTRTLTEWAESIGIGRDTLAARLKAGWPITRALTPARKYG